MAVEIKVTLSDETYEDMEEGTDASLNDSEMVRSYIGKGLRLDELLDTAFESAQIQITNPEGLSAEELRQLGQGDDESE